MPTLYLIPVPIAGAALHTVPPYAADVARRLDVFLVERAKTARHYLKALGALKPLAELTVVELGEEGLSAEAVAAFRAAVAAGRDVGVLSEAGCPGVADPGAAVVALAHREGVRVVPLVGPSSLLLALMASGMNGQRFAFHGYLSPKRGELARDLRRLEQQSERLDQTEIFIETPYRSRMVLETAVEALRADTLFGVAQDLTGVDELVRTLPASEWKRLGLPDLGKLPAVFTLYRAAAKKGQYARIAY
jgi:16S rRNA (cytidine1402-2'-O)-methyltransferase